MIKHVVDYLSNLSERFGDGWNRFWFTPSDPFALCVIRALTGVLVLYWHLSYTPDLARFFSADGWLPLSAVESLELANSDPGSSINQPSYLDFFSTPGDLLLVHIAGATVLALFTLGVLTRITSVLSLVVVLSYIHRAPVLTSQLEPIITLVMFYLCLGPAGVYLSVDAWLKRRKAEKSSPGKPVVLQVKPAWSATVATRLIQVHLAMIFGIMGLSQLMSDSWWSGMGMWWLITRPDSRLVDLTGLHAYRYVLEAWTHAMVIIEILFAVLVWNKLARPLLLFLVAVMLLGLVLVTGQVAFAAMMLIACLAYVSPQALKSLLPAGKTATSVPHAVALQPQRT